MTNQERAVRGFRAMIKGDAEAHQNWKRGGLQEVLAGALANMMHTADIMLLDFEAALESAREHFKAEGGQYNDGIAER